jgi:hypothetical protein
MCQTEALLAMGALSKPRLRRRAASVYLMNPGRAKDEDMYFWETRAFASVMSFFFW